MTKRMLRGSVTNGLVKLSRPLNQKEVIVQKEQFKPEICVPTLVRHGKEKYAN